MIISYLSISWKNDGKTNLKILIDLVFPLLLTIILFLTQYFFLNINETSKLFFQSKSFGQLLSMFQILPGFFIAALAAIITIKGKRVNEADQNLRGLVNYKRRNISVKLLLTRTLAFLALESILLIISSSFISYIYEYNYFGIRNSYIFSNFINFLYVFIVIQILSITCFCLYFIGDRLNRTF